MEPQPYGASLTHEDIHEFILFFIYAQHGNLHPGPAFFHDNLSEKDIKCAGAEKPFGYIFVYLRVHVVNMCLDDGDTFVLIGFGMSRPFSDEYPQDIREEVRVFVPAPIPTVPMFIAGTVHVPEVS